MSELSKEGNSSCGAAARCGDQGGGGEQRMCTGRARKNEWQSHLQLLQQWRPCQSHHLTSSCVILAHGRFGQREQEQPENSSAMQWRHCAWATGPRRIRKETQSFPLGRYPQRPTHPAVIEHTFSVLYYPHLGLRMWWHAQIPVPFTTVTVPRDVSSANVKKGIMASHD
ncbi:hypothetical protein BC826DRAFT_123856 [Russula brevipes]|nr:hypothetical protein BC826DRAFT_123856 [Russula brevipes]